MPCVCCLAPIPGLAVVPNCTWPHARVVVQDAQLRELPQVAVLLQPELVHLHSHMASESRLNG